MVNIAVSAMKEIRAMHCDYHSELGYGLVNVEGWIYRLHRQRNSAVIEMSKERIAARVKFGTAHPGRSER